MQKLLADAKTVKKIDKVLLSDALHLFHQKFKDQMEAVLQDDQGVFGYVFSKYVIVAKGYIVNNYFIENMVSCHKRAVYSAYNTGKKLLMYVRDSKTWFEFDPSDIMKNSLENIRGSSTFLNFSIDIGREI